MNDADKEQAVAQLRAQLVQLRAACEKAVTVIEREWPLLEMRLDHSAAVAYNLCKAALYDTEEEEVNQLTLKPCPLCEGQAMFDRVELDNEAQSLVICSGCCLSTGWEENPAAAAARWNSRPTESSLRGQILMLRNACWEGWTALEAAQTELERYIPETNLLRMALNDTKEKIMEDR